MLMALSPLNKHLTFLNVSTFDDPIDQPKTLSILGLHTLAQSSPPDGPSFHSANLVTLAYQQLPLWKGRVIYTELNQLSNNISHE